MTTANKYDIIDLKSRNIKTKPNINLQTKCNILI